MSAVAETPAAAVADARKAGDWLLVATAILLGVWVLLPIYLLIVNALSSPEQVTAFPKRFFPSFDLGSLSFFINFAGVARALWNSVLVATLTMILSIGFGAPAGYALSRFDFPGKGTFRFLVLMLSLIHISEPTRPY